MASEHQDQQELQGLVCNDVLRDWLKHLEHEAEDGQRLSMGAPDRQSENTHQ